MKSRPVWKRVVTGCILAAIVLVIIVAVQQRRRRAAEEAALSASQVETARVEKRELVSTVSATGKVVALDSIEITSALTGTEVTEVAVSVGDTVQEGDVICVFDDASYQRKVASAEGTQAQTALKNNRSIVSAEEALRDAEADYLREIPNLQSAVDRALHDWQVAAMDHTEAREKYDTAVADGRGADEVRELQKQLFSAETSANNAYNTYKQALDNQETQTVVLAEALEKAQYDLELARLEKSTDTSSSSVEEARENVEKTVVTAPISGTVTEISVSAGKTYANGTIAKIEDCSGYEVSAQIDEYDIAKIKIGQEVIIKTNGTGDLEFTGHIGKIAPHADSGSDTTGMSSSSGDTSYSVTVTIDAVPEELRLDMTAKLSIILERATDILSVPYEAVQEAEDGSFFVELSDHTIVPVTKGLESDYYAEINGDGIVEGVEVISPREDTDSTDPFEMMQRQGAMGGM